MSCEDLKKLYEEIYLNEYIKEKPTNWQIGKLVNKNRVNPCLDVDSYKKAMEEAGLKVEFDKEYATRNEYYKPEPGLGSTSMLLMFILRHVKENGYIGAIFVSDYRTLSMPSGIKERLHEWLSGTDAIFKRDSNMWEFPRYNSRVYIGYVEKLSEAYKYGGVNFQHIAFDGVQKIDREAVDYLSAKLRSCPQQNDIIPRSIAIETV